MSGAPVPDGVGWTALMTGWARAVESGRPDAVVLDPWAGILLEAAGGAGIGGGSSPMWAALQAYFAGRTPFYDAHVRAAVEGGARQVVLLAAGLDARAARLALPDGLPVFEVDRSGMLDFKAAVLAAHGIAAPHRVPVAADLTEDWVTPLRAAGFRPELPTAWVAEGLLMYLDAADADRLLAQVVAHSAPGSGIACEYFGRPVRLDDFPYGDDVERGQVESVLAMFRSGPDATPARWLPRHGLVPGRDTDVAAELRAGGRWVPPMFGGDGRPDPSVVRLASGWLR